MKRITFTLTYSLCAIATVAGGIAAAGLASAQEPAATGSGSLEKFIGSGTCTGKSLNHDRASYHATTGKFSSEKIMDGNWVVIRYDEDPSSTVQKPYHVVQYIGYDTPKKRLMAVSIDNSGSGYSTGTSAGWNGDRIMFDESASGMPVSFRDTFTTSGSGMSGHTGAMRNKSGQWVTTDEESCKRS